ncbi:hypothetical protein CDD81_4738 [Ophiocordyceps australis]|uniref:Enoyl reductase (ER) domain-containing protein n=1 Tax=Ophiocordyceps australis TaxID=1399860 RepID=A0A2C5XNA9_9HYPO|nr:hypothetical protein CDD81_4738 [Ophiocordyceps australis]
MTIVDTYRACVLDEPGGAWALRQVALQPPKQGEILVKVICCGFCQTDVSTREGGLGTRAKWPVVPGHEFIGDIVELGPGVSKWSIGDRVGGAWHGGHDGTCRQCNHGFFQGCDNQAVNGVSRAGGFAEYCNLRSEAAVRIPKDADPVETASLLCAGVTIFNAMRQQKVLPGETVAIQGLGGLGHLGIQYARKMGFRVVAISTSDSKKELALQLGAHHYINTSKTPVVEELKKLGGAKMVVLTAPDTSLMGQYAAALTWQGKLVVLAPVGDFSVNATDLVHNSCSVGGWHAGHALDCEEAIDFAHLEGIRCMVERFPFEKIEEAAEHLHGSKARFRIVLTMQ